MADEGPTKTEQITSFSEESLLSNEVAQNVVTPSEMQDPYDTQSLMGFLSRPFPIKETSWTAAAKVGDMIASADFPHDLIKIPSFMAKLRNFAYMRAGVRVGVRLNGTKFHYGKLLIMWAPAGANIGTLFDATDNLYSASSFPHIIVSPTENEVNEIVIPYALPQQFISLFDLNQNISHLGGVYCFKSNDEMECCGGR